MYFTCTAVRDVSLVHSTKRYPPERAVLQYYVEDSFWGSLKSPRKFLWGYWTVRKLLKESWKTKYNPSFIQTQAGFLRHNLKIQSISLLFWRKITLFQKKAYLLRDFLEKIKNKTKSDKHDEDQAFSIWKFEISPLRWYTDYSQKSREKETRSTNRCWDYPPSTLLQRSLLQGTYR